MQRPAIVLQHRRQRIGVHDRGGQPVSARGDHDPAALKTSPDLLIYSSWKGSRMWWFADGDRGLIRVKTSAPMGSKEFFDADAERFTARGGWGPSWSGYNLASEAINSGDYAVVDEAEAMRVMAAMHRQIQQ
jgi:hypothetical protein